MTTKLSPANTDLIASINRLPSPALRAAADRAAQTLAGAVGAARIAGAVAIVAADGVTRHADGRVTVRSRHSNAEYLITSACPCDDARFRAPTIAGRPACAHQIAAWIVAKAAAQKDAAARTTSCWYCGSPDIRTDADQRGQPGHCRYCGSAVSTPASIPPSIQSLITDLYG